MVAPPYVSPSIVFLFLVHKKRPSLARDRLQKLNALLDEASENVGGEASSVHISVSRKDPFNRSVVSSNEHDSDVFARCYNVPNSTKLNTAPILSFIVG